MKTENQTEGQPQVATSAVVWPEWTHEPPQAVGYYWWRHDEKCTPFIVEVRPVQDGEREAVFPWGRMIIFRRQCDAQWAGPMPLPTDCHTVTALARATKPSSSAVNE